MITKKALNVEHYKREWFQTNSARNAWSDIIEIHKELYPNSTILLPSYIGWSPNEGSGIFDSVLKSGLKSEFYGLGLHLEIDFENLKQQISKDKNQIVLLVHYFGFVDSKYKEIVQWLEDNKIFFVEDCAHAWLTDLIGGVCGRKGAFSFYSLHKLLPISKGGIMVNNFPENLDTSTSINPAVDLNYDLFSIYTKRRANYIYLSAVLSGIEGIEIIYKELQEGICPQTLPVIVEHYNRNSLYEQMNKRGFGMVSLYHTMITELTNSPYEAATTLSKKIINFPIHQDVGTDDLDLMIVTLKNILHG